MRSNSPNHNNSISGQQIARVIESYLIDYCGLATTYSVETFINRFPDEFLTISCPEALHMPAAFIVNETLDEVFVGVHISDDLSHTFSANPTLAGLLSQREGLNAFMILVEEISHFHHYVSNAHTNSRLSRFDLELQAELEKVVICSLALIDTFGKSHIKELVQILFNESIIHGTITDYGLASRIAEKFWKQNLVKLGPNIIFDARFRKLFRDASRLHGDEKRRVLETTIAAA